MNCGPPGFSIHGIFQDRILEWVAISSSRGSSRAKDQTHISCIGRRIIHHWAIWEASVFVRLQLNAEKWICEWRLNKSVTSYLQNIHEPAFMNPCVNRPTGGCSSSAPSSSPGSWLAQQPQHWVTPEWASRGAVIRSQRQGTNPDPDKWKENTVSFPRIWISGLTNLGLKTKHQALNYLWHVSSSPGVFCS